ncbi:MAG: hypothetical protein HGA49_11690 [Eubacteriaceae bacterium]|nr:hypothetical protein [Eubacteriaceae bacterium]
MKNLTREKILAMEPGKEMDALITEKVFKKCPHRTIRSYYCQSDSGQECMDCGEDLFGNRCPQYSTNIATAFELFTKWGYQGSICFSGNEWHCEIMYGFDPAGYGVYVKAEGTSAPEAICKAALLSVLAKEGDG